MQLTIDGVPFLLRSPQAFPWLSTYGRCFYVYDKMVSGNIGFCMDGPYGKLFVKYAGAETLNYCGRVRDAVMTLKNAMPLYLPKREHMVNLLAHGDAGEGYAAVFRFEDGVPLHGAPADPCILERLRHLPAQTKLRMLDGLFELSAEFAMDGLMPFDFGPDNIIVNFDVGSATLCDVDLYRPFPLLNDRGRMPGLPRYLAPEEYRMGATLDGATTVYRMGALAFDFFGQGHERGQNNWCGPKALYQVAERAVSEERVRRFSSAERFLKAWRDAVGKVRII